MSLNKDRILELLKTGGPLSVAELAESLAISKVGTRAHLLSLEQSGMVTQQASPAIGAGRPRQMWQLAPAANSSFPDYHAELSVELIEGVREVFGDEGLQELVGSCCDHKRRAYADSLVGLDSLESKLEALAQLRSGEGYMAQVSYDVGEKAWRYVQHHCPISIAARSCQALCRGEQVLFEQLLEADVELTEHLLQGSTRCEWLVRPRQKQNQLRLI